MASYIKPSSYISLKYDIGIPDDATITGVGSSSFSDAGYGSLTIPGTSTTVTQAIQAVLDRAANGPLGILWDVRCSVGVQGSGNANPKYTLLMRRPGNLHIVGKPGCGVILRAQCNAAILANDLPTWGTPSSAIGTNGQINTIGGIAFGNVLIEGMYFNGNSGTTTGNPSVYTPGPNQTAPTFGQIYYLNAIRLFGVQDVTFRDCTIVGCGGFHVVHGNWQRLRYENCTIDSLGAGGNVGGNDCLHFNGPGDRATIRDCLMACEDDHIAINTADGSNASQGAGQTVPAWGSLTNIHAFNTTVTRAHFAGNFTRIMPAAGCTNTGHRFDGVHGTTYGLALMTSSPAGAGPGVIGSVLFNDVDIDYTNHGITAGDGAVTSINHLALSNIVRSTSMTIPFVDVTTDLKLLTVDGFAGIAGQTGTDCPLMINNAGSTVELALITRATSPGSAGLIANGGTITNLVISASGPVATVKSGDVAPAAHSGDSFH